MTRKFIASLIGLSLLAIQAVAQQDHIRGGWLKSRTEPPRQTKSPPPKPTPRIKPEPPVETREPCAKAPQPATASAAKLAANSTAGLATLGLGYTLFMVNDAGNLMRVSPDRQFKSGERVRLLVETNRNGYIYIFTQENDEAPKLLYPNIAIANGNNCVLAHRTFWLPEEGEIEFDEHPAREKLTVVFSERPLAKLAPSAMPEGDLVEARLFQEVTRQTAIRKGGQVDAGMLLTKTEGARGVRLNLKDPAPAVILLNQDAAQTRIVATIQLTHR